MGSQSARLAGEEGDGFVTNELSTDKIKSKLFPALKDGARAARKDYDEDKQKALTSISFWKGAMIKAFFDVDVHDQEKFRRTARSSVMIQCKICYL